MATSTTSDPLPSRTLPSHPAYPSDASPAAPFVRHDAYEQGQTSGSMEVVKEDLKGKGKGKERAVDLRGFAAGTASGMTKLVVGHPFDVIKVRLQCSPPGTYGGPWECLKTTIRAEGPRALYKGATPPAIGWTLSDSMLMGSLHQYRLLIARFESGWRSGWRDDGAGLGKDGLSKGLQLSLGGHFIAGLLAGQTVCVVACPTEHLKARLQMQTTGPRLYTGPIDCAKKIVQVRGVRGLWHGFGATLMFRSWMGMMFFSYEVILRAFRKHVPDMKPGTANFLAGGLASNTFWMGSFPFDAVKNRLMTDSLTNPRYPTWMSCARQIYAEGGAKAFYRGFVPCILRAFPTNASALLVWESTMRFIGAEKLATSD
ncbi:hypothetical protein NBRC10512_007107 [Rhodotorula toruloides]|uniref:RHTO0S16e04258g1_1 n=2 Tax=Rhodotorula toruloides TaxID=5286 RepID=A0A061BE28_RHOTO|nr:mitochondrial carrier protein [Rhodotorula toruloides NP11]EMS18340.1 mitochondrial carrier protein [Rhodotorula toruloides NP11]CDR48239.1 RHTO0S16e04258g1_1 [Rhodotorula toruloides]